MNFPTIKCLVILLAITPAQDTFSAPPEAFVGSSNGGVITAGHPGGFFYTNEVNNIGLMQRTLTSDDGTVYVRLVVTALIHNRQH